MNERKYEEEVNAILGKTDSLEREFVAFKKENLIKSLRIYQILEKKKENIIKQEISTLKEIKDVPTHDQTVFLERIRKQKDRVDEEIKILEGENPEAYYGLHLRELKEHKRELSTGKIVETDYVRKNAEEMYAHSRAGVPVFIHGHLGTGKTELAFHMARKYMKKEALIISGSRHTSLAEMYGHQILTLPEIDSAKDDERLQKYLADIDSEFQKWVTENPKASEKEKDRKHDAILSGMQERLAHEYSSGTISGFLKKNIYKAMEEGRPVIIDEVNAIPHEVLISLNHLLTRKPGDKVRIQQNGNDEITIQEGFCFILTGNIGKEYVDRQDMDPAFLSRLYKIKHDYLPQSVEGGIEEAPKLDKDGNGNELFELIMVMAMDKHGTLEIPEGETKKLWNLAKMAKVTQDVFSGKNTNKSFYFDQADGVGAKEYRLKEGVLSIRALDRILSAWKMDGFKKELDYYVFKEFISQSTEETDKAYLYFIAVNQFDFFKSAGWDQIPNYGKKGIVSSFNVSCPENESGKKITIGQREAVDILFGKGPERVEWPEENSSEIAPKKEEISSEKMKMVLELSMFEESIQSILSKAEKSLKTTCKLG